ncbi:hypothetical protein AZH11_02780 [Pseudomonas simiae]|nr:hypothetical protein AZH11_02780 [Pseudomonas simiae]
MNTAFKTLATAMLLLGSANVFASSIDLTVTGKIVPSACTPGLSSDVIDYGKMSAKDLNDDKKTPLPQQTLQFTVTCDAATLIAIEAKDNRPGSASENDQMVYGLGLVNGTEKLGGMELRLLRPVADTVPIDTIGSYDSGVTWGFERYLMTNNRLAPAVAGVNTPIPVQVWTADLDVQAFIAKASDLTLTNEVAIDGSVTLTVLYL